MSNQIVKDKVFIVFGLQPWDFEMGSNCKNIAMELAKNNKVVYVNRPIERWTLYKFKGDKKINARLESLKKGIGVLEMEGENLWVLNPRTILESINWMPPGRMYHVVSRANAKRLAKQIKWALNKLNFKNAYLFIDNDFLKGFYLNDYLQADMVIYYIRDFLLSQKYFIKHGTKMEPGMMKKADVVVANSLYLAEYSKQYNKHSFDIGQGCELEGYIKNDHEVPADIKNIKYPIIGYCGALLETRLDINLLRELAEKKKEWSIVLVGPEDEAFKKSSLHQLPNIHFLGSKPVDSLPAYVHQFDICINPQLLNQMTIGNYPRKIDEYLAAGKPVVATDTKAMEIFKDHCYLAKDLNGYIEGIIQQLKETDTVAAERKKDFALSHTWEASVNEMYAAINTYKNKAIL
jgi:glycosyltransferase involved in cell wall biosynthesis